jgi:APA family basic amino acid/polyamine antiporter
MSSSRAIGFWTAVALVMGNMIGSGVFLLPASLASYGGLALAGWLVSATGAVFLAVVFARLARLHPDAGGPYAYTRRAFGDLAGFLVGWGYWISVWSGCAALAVAFVGYLDPLLPSLVRAPISAALLAVTAVWVLTAVNMWGMRAAGQVQVTTTVLKVLPLLVIGVAGAMYFRADHFAVATVSVRATSHSVLNVTTLTLWALLGLESATIPAASVRDPERTIPRATVTGTLVAAAIYIVSTIGVMSLVAPAVLAHTTAPFADAARVLMGDRAAVVVAVGAAISCFGALNGWILVMGQLPLAIAQDGLFPRMFGRVSSSGTPASALVIGSVLTTALIAANYSRGLVELFTFIITLSTLSTLVPYVFCSLASGMTRRDAAGGLGKIEVASVVAFVFSIGAIIGAGYEVVFWGFVLLLAGLPVYVWVVRKRVTSAV